MISGFFVCNGIELKNGPVWNMTELSEGSMRFRWNENNQVRDDFFSKIEGNAVPVELIHSKKIYFVNNQYDTLNLQGDGILTLNSRLIPTVTVADCVPIFVFDKSSGVFGALHSGWKGTGICVEAYNYCHNHFGTGKEDFCVVIGPHIGSCCYEIGEDRADFFSKNFGINCVEKRNEKFYLSLTVANYNALIDCGIPSNNIRIVESCTCCTKENGSFKFGSFRRQAAGLPSEMDLEERLKHFCVQAAFVRRFLNEKNTV